MAHYAQIHYTIEAKATMKGKTAGYLSFCLLFSVGNYFNTARVILFI